MRHWCAVLLTVCAVGVLAGCNGPKENPDKVQTAPGDTAPAQPDPIDTPKKLLLKVLTLASNKRYEELAEHMVPLRLRKPPKPGDPTARAGLLDVRAEILEGIRSRKKAGDYAYSNKALLAIITNHLDDIGPVPEELLESWAAGKGLGQDEALQATAKAGGKDLLCFRRSGAFVLMKKEDGHYRLVCWQNLNRVLGEDRGAGRPEDRETGGPEERGAGRPGDRGAAGPLVR